MKKWRMPGIVVVGVLIAVTVFYLPLYIQKKNIVPTIISGLTNVEALQALVTTTGAVVKNGEVQFFAVLENRFQTMAELEAILLDVAGLLRVSEGNVEKGEGPTYRVFDLIGTSEIGSHTHIVVQSNPGDQETMPPQTYLLVICRDNTADKLSASLEKLSLALQPYAENGQLSYYLTGEFPGKLAKEKMVKLAKTALQSVRAEVLEGVEDEELVSYTAYTPLLTKHITVNDDRFNVNIAIRYDDFHNKTVVWAGFPLIHDPY